MCEDIYEKENAKTFVNAFICEKGRYEDDARTLRAIYLCECFVHKGPGKSVNKGKDPSGKLKRE